MLVELVSPAITWLDKSVYFFLGRKIFSSIVPTGKQAYNKEKEAKYNQRTEREREVERDLVVIHRMLDDVRSTL